MYEIGKLYRWRNQVGIMSQYNGTECVPDAPARWWRFNDTGETIWGQSVDCGHLDPMVAFRGDLVPVNPPKGEQSITNMFKVDYHVPEPAHV